MANNSQRMWMAIPSSDGVIIARFPLAGYNPKIYPQEQFGIAEYLEKMPASEAIDMGVSLAAAGNMSLKQFAQQVRTAKLRQIAAIEAMKPADPLELAKLSAMMEGTNLDPSSGWDTTMDSLVNHDVDAEADEAVGT